ncbi:MAG TPA: DUF3106 domain-containing protein [Candidatus Angelobacter sp.]|nr:DUF3106 domain-containing protein [Candidatus Angelobacter sp.]
MNWAPKNGILFFALLLGLSAGAQRKVVGGAAPHPHTVNNASQNPNAGAHPPARKMGDWLREHQNLPPDQQEKLLENDPNFKKLSPERQAELKERLRKFNSLTPEQRERALNRMEFMASLTQQQREQIRDAQKTLQGLPADRQVMVHKALRHLRQMDPQQRQQVMNEDRFKSMFSEQERGILGQLSAINPQEGEGHPNPQQAPTGQQPK